MDGNSKPKKKRRTEDDFRREMAAKRRERIATAMPGDIGPMLPPELETEENEKKTNINLEAEFLLYHQQNPQVYELVKRFAYEAIRAGYTKFGVGAIWERIRWEITITTRSNIEAADFKMPNNHRAYYSRKFLEDHPQYQGFFRTARLRSVDPHPVDRYGKPKEDGDNWDLFS